MLDVGVVAFDLEEIRAEAAEVEHGFKADSAFEGAITTHSPAGKKCQIYWTKLKQWSPTKLSIPASRMVNP